MNFIDIAIAKGYTEESLLGAGALKGQDGVDGADGKDAYALAVEKGFEGTEQEWLESLKGADGKDGTNGKDGIDGQDGKDGVDGYSPTIVENENNTDSVYKLDIVTKDSTFTTPNLKGKDGSGSSTIEISAEEGNALTSKDDGLYVPTTAETKVSEAENNIIETKEDGIYVAPTDLSEYVQKVDGKGLSTNDLTDELKATYDKAKENVQSDWSETDTTSDAYINNKPTKLSDFEDDITFELTHAEYQALSDEEKNNGTNYYITDVDNNGNITGYTAGTGIQISKDKTISVTDISKNYIDNSDFCINQNGQTEYTGAGNTVDRWYTDGGILTVKENGVTFTNNNTEVVLTRLKQELPYSFNEFAGKAITISTKVNGQIYSKTATLPSEKPTTESGTATQFIALSANEWALNLNYSITADYFVPYFALAAGYSMDIEWVKMEVSDARTVYIEPDYSTELLKINFTDDRGKLDFPYTKKETNALFANLPFKWQLLGTSSPSTQENENTTFSQIISSGLPFVVFHSNGVFCFGDGAHKGTLFGNTSCAICNVTYTEAGLLNVSVGQGVAYIYQMINITG